MKGPVVAIASGKGGTGKTTVATNLSRVLAEEGQRVTYLDCDVEEPNGHIFLRPHIDTTTTVTVPVPAVDPHRCTACGKCAAICEFNAIAVLGGRAVVFPNLCHGCGGCYLVCPNGAITETARTVGVVEEGDAGDVHFVHGRLRVGEAMSPPLIRQVKERAPETGISIVDSPPGTSCPVIQSVLGADLVLLVTEPTPFGLHDLKLALEMVIALGIPIGVIVNRADSGDDRVHQQCRLLGVPIVMQIPDDRLVAEAYSRGRLAVEAVPHLRPLYVRLAQTIEQLAAAPQGGRQVGAA